MALFDLLILGNPDIQDLRKSFNERTRASVVDSLISVLAEDKRIVGDAHIHRPLEIIITRECENNVEFRHALNEVASTLLALFPNRGDAPSKLSLKGMMMTESTVDNIYGASLLGIEAVGKFPNQRSWLEKEFHCGEHVGVALFFVAEKAVVAEIRAVVNEKFPLIEIHGIQGACPTGAENN